MSNLGTTPYLPEADSIEVKRTDGSVVNLRVFKRSLPGNVGHYLLLACPFCCSLRRALYGWEGGGKYTSSALRSQWQCRKCAGLRYASEGGALVIRSRCAMLRLTSPSFCTTASERVYITTSSDNANGGSQGAVGDRRAAICGANVAGAGAL